ncbi:MAG: hypothetical protein ACTSRZ_08355 [Promethearchaeota archaeon]
MKKPKNNERTYGPNSYSKNIVHRNNYRQKKTFKIINKLLVISILLALFGIFLVAEDSLNSNIIQNKFRDDYKGIITSANDKTLNITVYDRANNPIENAYVEINDGGSTKLYQYSDQFGNATFSNIDNSTWNIIVKYAIGDRQVNYTINTTQYNLDVPSGGFASYSVYCNLTTVYLEVGDSSLPKDHWGLYNVNVTIQNATTGENITSYYTDFNGNVILKLPTTDYDMNIQYQGDPVPFFIYIVGGDNNPDYVKNLTLVPSVPYYDYDVYCVISDIATSLNISQYNFTQTTWNHYQDYSKPYHMSMYYEDVVKLKIQWNDTQNEIGIENSSAGEAFNNWTIKRGENIVNSSAQFPYALQPIAGEPGNYTFIIDSKDYYAGDYLLTLKTYKTGYQDAYLYLYFTIWNFTTQLTINISTPIHVKYSTELNLMANYSSILPYIHNISDSEADLFYNIPETSFSGQLTYDAVSHNFTIDNIPVNIPVGTYDLQIYGNGTNFDYVFEVYIFIVDPIETDVAILIDQDYRISSTFMKVAHGENVSFMVNYTTLTGNEIANSILNVYINDILLSNQYYSLITEGIYANLWNVSFPANLYTPNIYTVKTQLIKQNYEEKNKTFSLSILDYWDTRIDIIEAPSEYNWGDNATFKIKYLCDEEPSPPTRENMPIDGATINEINITIKSGIQHILQLQLTSSNLNTVWSYKDLSYLGGSNVGVYEVWFLTNYLNLTSTTKFYIIPSISKTIYREASTTNIYFDLNTLDTQIKCYNSSNPISELDFFTLNKGYNEYLDILVQLNVSEPTSPYYGAPLNNANVQYVIINKTNGAIVEGPLTIPPAGNGKYIYHLDSLNPNLGLGEFQFIVNTTNENYTYSEASFEFNITDIITYNVIIPPEFKISSTKAKCALAENITIYIDLAPESEDASVNVYLDSNPTPVTWLYKINGAYDYNLTNLGSNIGLGLHTLRILAFKGTFTSLEKVIDLEIIEKWDTNIEIEVPPAETMWGHNDSFIIHYYVSEEPRDNIDINNSYVDSLVLYNGTQFLTLNETTNGTLWGWQNLASTYGNGYYLIWINTSLFYMQHEIIIYVKPTLIGGTLFMDKGIVVPIDLHPVNTEFQYWADPTPSHTFDNNPNMVYLLTGENTTIYFNYTVADPINQYYNKPLNSSESNLNLIVTNRSNSNIIINTNLVYNQSLQSWPWTVKDTDLSQHEFLVEINATCWNYTTQYRSFLLIIGQAETTFNYTIDPSLKANPLNQKSLRVAQGENLTLSLSFPNLQQQGDAWIQLYLNDYMLPMNHLYWISSNSANYTTPINSSITPGIYTATLIANQKSYTPSNQTFSVIVMSYWPAELHVIEPPWMYPWGNIISLNTTYYCTQYPRDNWLITNATISTLEIILIKENTLETKLILGDTERLAGIWGYSEMIATKGAGYYNIWFNSNAIDLDIEDVQSYYIVPTIQKGVYNQSQAKPRPNYSVRPVETKCFIEQTSNIQNLNLKNMVVYLDQTLSINFHYYVDDLESVYSFEGLNPAKVKYTIYNASDYSIVRTGFLTPTTNGTFPWNIPTCTIGNYIVNITANLTNFRTVIYSFTLNVKKFDVVNQFISDQFNTQGETLIIETPQNKGFEFQFKLTNYLTNQPITDANVIFILNGQSFTCTEISAGIYKVQIPANEVKKLKVGESYTAYIQFSKVNYTDNTFAVKIRIDLPVDPWFGIPWVYWGIIIGISAGFFIFIYVRKQILLKQVPVILRRIDKMIKIISKKRPAPDMKWALSPEEEKYAKFSRLWKSLKLDMLPALDLSIKDLSKLDEELKSLIIEEEEEESEMTTTLKTPSKSTKISKQIDKMEETGELVSQISKETEETPQSEIRKKKEKMKKKQKGGKKVEKKEEKKESENNKDK